jgi:predicted peptidase
MRYLASTVALCIAVAGCAGVTPSGQPTSTATPMVAAPGSTAPASTVAPRYSTPTQAPSPSAVALPAGLVAYPGGSSDSPLPYLEYLPPGYDDGTPQPLLVFLHGVGEAGTGSIDSLRTILKLGLPRLIADGRWPAERPFVVLMPQETAAQSQACRFGTDVDRFLDYAVDRYAIDESRIYLTGISCGATGVLDYLARSQEGRVAATVPIASAPYEPPYVGTEVIGGCAVAKTPTWFFHGALDEIVPVSYVEDAVADLRACDPPPTALRLTVYPEGHHDEDTWGRTYDGSAGHDIYRWLLGHRSKPHD